MPDKKVGIPYKTKSIGSINSYFLKARQMKIISTIHIEKTIHTNAFISPV